MYSHSLLSRLLPLAALAGALLLLACDLTDDKKKPPVEGPPVDTTGVDTTVIDTSGAGPFFPPGPPTAVLAVAGDSQAVVSWTAPEYAGSAAVTGYWVAANEDSTRQCSATASSTSCTLTGLRNKATYTFVVRAVSRHGFSEPSLRSQTVVPLPALLPAPQGLVAVAGSGSASLSWTSPPPGTWVSVYSPQDLSKSCKADSVSACRITGLEFGKSYTFVARAHNEVGAGAPSAPTAPLFSSPTPPGAPFSVTAAAGDTQATVSWTAPRNNGGDSITGYEVSSLNSTGVGCATSAAARSCVVRKLAANAPVSFRVRAVNALGPGPSATTTAVTPYFVQKVPGPPSNVSVSSGNGQVTLSWSAASGGAAPVTRYRVTYGNITGCSTTLLSCTVKGLVNGGYYTFQVRAVNSYGEGAAASASGIPSAPPGP